MENEQELLKSLPCSGGSVVITVRFSGSREQHGLISFEIQSTSTWGFIRKIANFSPDCFFSEGLSGAASFVVST